MDWKKNIKDSDQLTLAEREILKMSISGASRKFEVPESRIREILREIKKKVTK